MPLATEVAEAFVRVANEIKLLREEAGTVSWELGPYATQNSVYREAAQNAAEDPLKMAVLSDSTSDSYVGGGVNGGSTNWGDTWPNRLSRKLRAQQGLPTGGRGWIPPSTPTWPGGYDYDTSVRLPANYTEMDELNFQLGIPGSLWLQDGHATNVYQVQVPLTAGCTSVDIVTTGYGGAIHFVRSNGTTVVLADSTGDRVVTRVTNPGTSITIKAPEGSGLGFAYLGLFEYVGDEDAGIRMFNLAQAAIRANEVQSWLGNSTFSMLPMLAAYQPDVLLVVLGSNDFPQDPAPTPETVLNSLGAIAMSVNSVAANCQVIFVHRPNPAQFWVDFGNMLGANAGTVGATVLNLAVDDRLTLGNTTLYVSDGVHFTSAGDEVMADVVSEHLKVEKQTSGGSGGGLSEEEIQTLIDATFATKPRRWQSEVIINSGELVDGYNDNIGGVLVDNDIMLYQASFRLSDPVEVIGGTGNLQIQWYAGSPTELETELITTTQVAAGEHDVIVTFATPMPYTINTVLRAKILMTDTEVFVPCHIQWRGRYTT